MFTFGKYHGLGNDFVVVEQSQGPLGRDEIKRVCRRHRGIGADGVLMVEPQLEETPPVVSMTVYNRDGSRPEMCGNGVRCVAAYAVRRWSVGERLVVDTDAGRRGCEIEQTGSHRWQVTVEMGRARVEADGATLDVGGRSFEYVEVDVGNPHAVIFGEADAKLIDRVGRLANDDHPAFGRGVNVEFVRRRGSDGAFVTRVYERGVGRTKACGTGACAVAAAARRTGRVDGDATVRVELAGGTLEIGFDGDRVLMTGEAEELFEGTWRPE